ncbi:MAG TPA: glycosyltransferase, partial [Caulobacteraceae bacterium]
MSERGQLKWGPPRLWRWRADRARDRRLWGRASANYARYLAQVPGDGSIWIQLGHTRKECGDLAGARLAYERAMALEADGEARRHLATVWTMQRLATAAGAISDADAKSDPGLAAAAYADHLAVVPDDGQVWIQYGHALAASGDAGAALIAFRQAAALPESDESGWFQLACLLRSQGHEAAAEPHFRRALELAPRYEAYRNLHGQQTPLARVSPVRDRRSLALDISDLVSFLAEHGRVSGIQRVQLELVKAILSGAAGDGSAVFEEIVFCFSEFGWAWAYDNGALRDLIAYTEADEVDLDEARAMRERTRVLARPLLPAAGSAYVVLGGFWGEADARVLTARMRGLGVAFGVMAHDLFAITMPELCEEGVGRQFEVTLRAGSEAWDFILANSAFTAGDVRDFLVRNDLRPVPVIPLPLAHGNTRASAGPDASILPGDLSGQPFVLCVGTIEPRKNHAGLIEAWSALAERRADLPWLVLAGRPGWRSEELVRRLRTGVLEARRIKWLPEVSERQLEALYGACLFTVFPSFAEGWGLPIGESLVHGKVCVTSNRTAMPEVGGRFALYADPHDAEDLAQVLEGLLSDDRALARRQALIKRSFRPRTWSDVASDMVAKLSALRLGAGDSPPPPSRPIGRTPP